MNKRNLQILRHISNREDHRLKTISRVLRVSEATVSRRIKNMKDQGIIKSVVHARGRTPAMWALTARAAAIVKVL